MPIASCYLAKNKILLLVLCRTYKQQATYSQPGSIGRRRRVWQMSVYGWK